MSKSYLPVAEFARALEAAGVVSDLDSIERIVIDLDPHDVVKVYVQRIAGPEIKQVAGLLGEMMRDGRAVNPDAPREHTPKHAAGCDLMLGHQVPDECQPSTEGGGA